ncbi:MAG: DUF1622 domain-containing protein [Lysobacter sp.]|nr:DUF1622 domain-containing protein [Lysobacter sp.]MDQ3269751.1 DUF1622 domain-containing protein [Pseudomonadota bacterium]
MLHFETVSYWVDVAGVVVIVAGLLNAVVRFAWPRQSGHERYRRFRHDLGRGILLGLEFLVAADIIRTVAITPTMDDVLVLGLIVLIRTFLSMALETELEGRWPWHRAQARAASNEEGE